jgi:hypothetical protein
MAKYISANLPNRFHDNVFMPLVDSGKFKNKTEVLKAAIALLYKRVFGKDPRPIPFFPSKREGEVWPEDSGQGNIGKWREAHPSPGSLGYAYENRPRQYAGMDFWTWICSPEVRGNGVRAEACKLLVRKKMKSGEVEIERLSEEEREEAEAIEYECTLCGETFATEEEAVEHAKDCSGQEDE